VATFMYLKFFVSAIAVSTLLALLLFIVNARRKAKAEPTEIPYLRLGKFMIIVSILIVLAITPLSIDMADHRNPQPDEVTYNGVTATEGFKVAIDYNCMGCHTIVGNGAYYAPDLNYVARKAGTPENIRSLLAAYAGTKYMPFNLTDRELDALTAWLIYLRDLNTNNWPPMPRTEVSLGGSPGITGNATLQQGKNIYESRCAVCHGTDGSGVAPGTPDFRDQTWWNSEKQALGVDGLVSIILNGKDGMPAFSGVLTEDEARSVLAYAMTFPQSQQGETLVFGGYSFEPSFQANLGRWYESSSAWIVYWLLTVFMATLLIYSFLFWYARG